MSKLLALAILAAAGTLLAITIHAEAGFVAVGHQFLRSSDDGINWNPQTVPGSASLAAVKYENGVYVATGVSGTILRATTPSTWTTQTSGSTSFFRDVAGNG